MTQRTPHHSISIAFVRPALASLAAHGEDAPACARRVGISTSLLNSDEARVTPACYGRLWLDIARTLDDEFFGLDLRRMKVGSYAMLCRQSVHYPTLRPALRHITHFLNLILDETTVTLTTRGKDANLWLADTPRSRPAGDRERVFAHETLLVLIRGLICWLTARRIPLRSTRFAYPAPAWRAEYETVFAREPTFGAADTRIQFSAATLDAPIVQTPQTATAFLQAAPANFILKYRDDRSLSARIRKRLRVLPPTAWPDITTVARDLAMGPSTLHRRLQREGVRYGELRDALRRDRAIALLTDSSVRVADIAAELGYAEPSAFYRAFRKWTGVQPGDYRRDPASLAMRAAYPPTPSTKRR